jgi:hypothetical protein
VLPNYPTTGKRQGHEAKKGMVAFNKSLCVKEIKGQSHKNEEKKLAVAAWESLQSGQAVVEAGSGQREAWHRWGSAEARARVVRALAEAAAVARPVGVVVTPGAKAVVSLGAAEGLMRTLPLGHAVEEERLDLARVRGVMVLLPLVVVAAEGVGLALGLSGAGAAGEDRGGLRLGLAL